MQSKHRYNKVLGIADNASLEDIKKAYREKAKQYHPDLNNQPDAHDKFIELCEAFEYLQNRLTGKSYDSSSQSFKNNSHNYQQSHYEWTEQQREKARQRAAYYARMRYDKFVRSKYYSSIQSLTVIFNGVLHLLVYIIMALPVIGIINLSMQMVWLGLLINVIFSPLSVHVIKNVKRPGLNPLWEALNIIAKKRTARLIALVFINVILFFNIVLHTLFPFWAYLILLVSSIMGAILFTKKFQFVLRFGVMPLIIHSFFVINFIFSSDPFFETYEYSNYNVGRYVTSADPFRTPKSSLIHLEGDAYHKYFGIRFYFNYDIVNRHSKIQYNFEDGLFGMQVLKRYKFL